VKPRNQHPDRWSVGKRGAGGELSAGHKPGYIWVNAFNGVGITVRVHPDDAESFGRWLIMAARLARQAE
jgi:hypothetical protein